MRRSILAALFVLGAAFPAAAGPLSAGDKATLQASMRQHIDRQLVDGAYFHFQPKDGAVAKLYPTKAHPMVMTFGDNFILCSDFRTPDGKDVNIDFYMARKGNGYVVFHVGIDDRGAVERLMKAGHAVAAD